MRTSSKLLVVAHKFNDIYYAISLPEWADSARKTLIIVTNRLDQSNFPMQDMFDEIHCIKSGRGSKGVLKTLIELKILLHSIDFGTLILSNISLVSSKVIISSPRCKQVILIEDGYMNYYRFKEQNNVSKRILMMLFGIKQKFVISKVCETYLLKPEIAEYYYGERKRLTIATELFKSRLGKFPSLQGKKIFVGQPLYHSYTGNSITVEQYNGLVNKAIRMFGIDYYVPHTMADSNENISCEKLDIGQFKCTFEVLASMFNMEFYSVSSSVLYSSKIVNPQCKCIMVQIPNIKEISPDSILYKYVDDIVRID